MSTDNSYYDKMNSILGKIVELFIGLGFSKEDVGCRTNYKIGNTYCIPVYVNSLGFLIEYADSKEDAHNNLYDDGDPYPLYFEESAILAGIYADIIREVPELCDNMKDLLVSGGFTIEHYNDWFYYVKAGIYCVPQHEPNRTKLFITYAESIDVAENDFSVFEAPMKRGR